MVNRWTRWALGGAAGLLGLTLAVCLGAAALAGEGAAPATPAAKAKASPTVAATTLNCQINIDSTGKYLQFGPPGGTGKRWIMKGTHSYVMRMWHKVPGPGGWEDQKYTDANWVNRAAQMDAMKAAGINCIRIFEAAYDDPDCSYLKTGAEGVYDQYATFCSEAKAKGLFVLIQEWGKGHILNGSSDEYFDAKWKPRFTKIREHLVAAGCDNVLFGTGNEPNNGGGKYGSGNWVTNTKAFIRAYRRAGYTGPVLCDTPLQDNTPWDNDKYGEIQSSDPSRGSHPGNIGFQEHEYGWERSFLPVATAMLNGSPAMTQFPIFITETGGSVNQGQIDTMANMALNQNLGGISLFWWNAHGAETKDWAGLELTPAGQKWRDHFFKAKGMPDGYCSPGSQPSSHVKPAPK
jgi:hypothetical protein